MERVIGIVVMVAFVVIWFTLGYYIGYSTNNEITAKVNKIIGAGKIKSKVLDAVDYARRNVKAYTQAEESIKLEVLEVIVGALY